jgi:hypothetical protein
MEPVSQRIAPSESNGAPPSVPGPSFAPLGFDAPAPEDPIFNTPEPPSARERWLWAIPIALALGLAVWLLDHRQKPVESPPMAFHISSNAARTVQLEWAPNSRAIRDSGRGEIDITDDGKTSQVVLSREQLRSGRLAYLRQSGDVGFQFTVYPASGATVHESTRLIAPAFSAPAQPPQLLPLVEDDAAQRKIRQLTDDLRKERFRADQLQNLVRILENRLGVQPESPKAEPQP